MNDLDGWLLGEALGGLFEFCRRFWHVLLVAAIVATLLVLLLVKENQRKDECRAKGGIPVDTTDRGLRCVKGYEIR